MRYGSAQIGQHTQRIVNERGKRRWQNVQIDRSEVSTYCGQIEKENIKIHWQMVKRARVHHRQTKNTIHKSTLSNRNNFHCKIILIRRLRRASKSNHMFGRFFCFAFIYFVSPFFTLTDCVALRQRQHRRISVRSGEHEVRPVSRITANRWPTRAFKPRRCYCRCVMYSPNVCFHCLCTVLMRCVLCDVRECVSISKLSVGAIIVRTLFIHRFCLLTCSRTSHTDQR